MAVSKDTTDDFKQVLNNAGIPLDEDDIKTVFNDIVEEHDNLISNDSIFSPFWRLIEAIVTTPYRWLMIALVTKVFPQSFVKTATGRFLDMFLWSVNLERKAASKALGYVLFERETGAAELVLHKGFTISTDRINGVVYRLLVLEETTLAQGETLSMVACEAQSAGDAYNLGAGYYQIPQAPIADLVRVYNPKDWLTTPGANDESDEDARERYRAAFQSVSGWFIDDKYKLIMSEFGGIKTDQIYIEHDAPRGPGTANAYILLDSGEASEPFLAAINLAVRDGGYHGLGDDMQAMELPAVLQDVTFEVMPVNNLTDTEKESLLGNVEQYIRCVFRENQAYDDTMKTWPQALFSYSTLNQELRNTFPNILSLYTPNRDFRVGLEIPRIGSLSLTWSEG